MSSPPNPSFHETPSKTTTFVMNSCEKTGVPRSADLFSKSGNKVLRPPYQPEKGQQISNEFNASKSCVSAFSQLDEDQRVAFLPIKHLTLFLSITLFSPKLFVSSAHAPGG